MASRRLRRESRLAFDALAIEGGLLSPEWLAKVAQLEAPRQAPADYDIEKGLQIRDEIGRYWRIAEPKWRDFVAARAAGGDSRAAAEDFVTGLLSKVFGFGSLKQVGTVTSGERSYPLGWAALDGRVPVVIAGPLPPGAKESALDKLSASFGEESRRRTPFGLCQEFLNANDGAMWGLVTDGLTLRVLRDNVSLTRPAWLEVDLQAIFTGGRFADFAALWLLMHQTRFGRSGQASSECPLEQWRALGREEGTRAREQLRDGVEAALRSLGQGFLAHRDNQALRQALDQGTVTEHDYFQQLLRLVYRLIFLLTVEERGLLHPEGTPDEAKALYAGGYSLQGMRERVVRRSAHDRHHDAWEAVKVSFRGLATGQPALGLPALAGIFAPARCRDLDAGRIENRFFLHALYRLSWLQEAGGLARVNWRDMGPEELGSVYESLLELTPRVVNGGREFTFAEGAEGKGHARKTTGSYYTPDSLVQVLLDSALTPVMERAEAARPDAKAEALLGLTVVDPACGSGHFLLAAARRLAARVAQHEAKGTASPKQYQHALRQVVSRCIFGVDLNPLAVELCKVGLWMEAVEPGLPLSFLDSHVQCGNALLGTLPGLMDGGIPDEAWAPIGEDDRKTSSALKKRNKVAKKQAPLPLGVAREESLVLEKAVVALDSAQDLDVTALAKKEADWAALRGSKEFAHLKLVADTWCSTFVWPKPAPTAKVVEVAPTEDGWRLLRDGEVEPSPLMVETVRGLTRRYGFFHWQLAFPQVFARGGFDVVLGNPPWERVKLQEQEFFASRSAAIASAENAAVRKKLIAKLPEEDPRLWEEWSQASREAEGQSHFVRQSGRFPLCGKGDVNTYALFAEHNRTVTARNGRAGFIVPTGLATDDTTKEYFGTLISGRELASFFGFENEEFVFPGVHHAFKFALLTIDRGGGTENADLVFFARQVLALADTSRHFTLSSADFELLNPNTKTCPTFRSQRDAELNLRMYWRAGVLWREDDAAGGNPWGLRFMAMIHMANDSALFWSRDRLEAAGFTLHGNHFKKELETWLPLMEAKMVHQFDHRFGTYEGQTQAQENQGKLPEFDDAAHAEPERLTHPYYWVAATEVHERVKGVWAQDWFIGWRDICRSTDQRTVIGAIFPRAAIGHTTPLLFTKQPPSMAAALYANLMAFVFDYAARQKVGGTHLTYAYFKQLPALKPEQFTAGCAWSKEVGVAEWIAPRVVELTYTAWDLEGFGTDVGFEGPPFRWDPERRALLRAELDAAFFHLYGLSRDDTDYILETFPIVKRNDEKKHGEYRTKRLILERYDALAAASRTGAYESPLVPPPAHASQRHPSRSR
ncbi:Eco57I restriction-modification methylase domain-containing protein [Corallococcus sp. AS-1-6]|uniref:Eco57I restriction-modification methylase domain-containing protein n=1 Tax=Corallococcus sp. AS-1-6 TaxID=2874599 RepID=UPI001CBE7F74|nr:N-6 DNA methylase [Corallococcus sp. AS-1-6]MBZ4372327.1 N-6 DNA methylase [Corallococcus sp. AS-1-6]